MLKLTRVFLVFLMLALFAPVLFSTELVTGQTLSPVVAVSATAEQWTDEELYSFVDGIVYRVFSDPGYYPGTDPKVSSFVFTIGCTGNCTTWVRHIYEVEGLTPSYMCAWAAQYALIDDFGRFERTGEIYSDGTAVRNPLMGRSSWITYLEEFLGNPEKQPYCSEFKR